MDDNLFSHPLQQQDVEPTYEAAAANPVENPVFSDQDR